MAVLDELKLSHRLHISKLIIEVDSQVALKMITKQIKAPWQLDDIIRQIFHILHNLDYMILLTSREGNKLADFLANVGCDDQCNRSYDCSSLPKFARGIHKVDKLSCMYLGVS
ncbi:hypothetical protein ACH5RR_000941 [Cinchona calisaya]|uniref:RNase H type-1 domain-containing protein n=1 Tax=Cinchona calisaya TaxID=153742 RepID=A0ABD3B2J1_9GENT